MEGVVLFMIPIVAIVSGASAHMLGTWLNHRRKQQILEQWQKERTVALEKGLALPEVPASLFEGPDLLSAIRSGVSLVLIGIVVYFATARGLDEDLALYGFIPTAVGVANLLYAALLWRRRQAPHA